MAISGNSWIDSLRLEEFFRSGFTQIYRLISREIWHSRHRNLLNCHHRGKETINQDVPFLEIWCQFRKRIVHIPKSVIFPKQLRLSWDNWPQLLLMPTEKAENVGWKDRCRQKNELNDLSQWKFNWKSKIDYMLENTVSGDEWEGEFSALVIFLTTQNFCKLLPIE